MSGSSPLARGLRYSSDEACFRDRIIPARAGFTSYLRGRVQGVEDHPRSRGVYLPMTVAQMAKAGSSPLARGLRRLIGGRP